VKADSRYIGYTQETARSIDLAYVAMEEDLLCELQRGDEEVRNALARVLKRLRERRAAMAEFVEIAVVR
jgi:hypothetical protein